MSKHAAFPAETLPEIPSTQSAIDRSGPRWNVQIDPRFLNAFPAESFNNYEAFTSQLGTVIKNEARTKVIHLPDARAGKFSDSTAFILKEYRYPLLAQLHTWNLHSKAEREFDGLRLLTRWGIPAVEPAACGTKRGPSGTVRSCFVLTLAQARTTTLRNWLKSGGAELAQGQRRLAKLLHDVGGSLRAAHAKRFFLFAAASKDILIRDDGRGSLAWSFVDLPYSRFLTPKYAAQFGQRRDLGALAGSVIKVVGEDLFESFYEGYLSDPFGGAEDALRKRVRHGSKIHNHETPLIRFRRGLKRKLKKTGR